VIIDVREVRRKQDLAKRIRSGTIDEKDVGGRTSPAVGSFWYVILCARILIIGKEEGIEGLEEVSEL